MTIWVLRGIEVLRNCSTPRLYIQKKLLKGDSSGEMAIEVLTIWSVSVFKCVLYQGGKSGAKAQRAFGENF